ncbi:heavy metal translocating P-type ATPase [Treponema sp. OMZ 799]|uniref:heavy metal translocating P-type ATPase n=1 Tax=Treponema sp. OMZ 799 TaxID=2563668 RepID=UPI0020A4F7E6|nr:heavy metal translocating P-type ATPase [Treponema sp. OMZ 799]UTC76920.1 heavy metal translocating P-type ATPase [Treponema sp. OMZ 799]
MNFYIAHRLPGRLRLRYNRKGLSRKQAVLVEALVSLQEGIVSIRVNPVSGSILIEYSGISEEEALSYIRALNSSYLENEELLASIDEPVVTPSLAVSLAGLLAEFFIRKLLPFPVRKILALSSIMPRVRIGIKALADGKPFCAETLDATALSLAYASGDLNTAGTIAMMLEMGEILEDYTRRKSYENLAQSFLNTKEIVHVLRDGDETEISANLLQAGDTVVLRIGSVIPADGTVVAGEASVNQASMTGEGLPVHKIPGDTVFASTVVEEGEIHVCVKACGRETRVSKIADMIDRSQSLKAASQIRAERTADRLVFYNFLLAGLTYAFTRNFAKAASTLLVDYSCAMKLSAPVCVLSAMKNCAEHGITVKGGKFLEDFARADTIVFDKTGTLTESQPSVKKIVTFGGRTEKSVLKIAACLEEHFPHSLARAVVREAENRGIEHREEHTKVSYILAHGLASTLNGEELRIGSSHFIFDDEGIPKTEEAEMAIEDLAKTGCSQLYLSVGKELAGIIAIEDPLRPEAKEVVSELHKLGIKNIIMLTGDGPQTARSIAKKTGIDRYHAQALPDTKADFIKRLKEEGKLVVMVGDGINDSPALSEADVGIAMGQASSIAGETADILLPDDGLRALPLLRKIAMGLINRININNKLIIGINSGLIAGELAGSIAPAAAALIHNGSTVAIGMSAMRSYEEPLDKSV